ncbi:MAG TPA: alpha/beta hydrolase [Solirubrobacteraceae bacterium]|jgi:acetyl esterase|nr:alpha/beta hydrolase [Solirubrobacteraceae bacterium]
MSNSQLDPDARALLEVMRAAGTPQLYTLSVAQARESMRAALVTRGDSVPLHSVEDISLPTPNGRLAMRLFRPVEGTPPIALFLHGGGWTLNDLDTHDRLCRLIARRSGWLLASLHYRRAPEHRHPAALEDAHVAYRWLLDNTEGIRGDPSGVALVGESSGAATAACLTLLMRDLGAPLPLYQVLAYPVTDASDHWPSFEERGVGYTLDAEFARWTLRNYVPSGHDLKDPYLLPLAAPDLGGLPPTLVMTAEFDPLRDEGIAFADRLKASGVDVEHIHVEDQMHGFLLLDRAVAKAGALIDRLADALSHHAPRRAAV